ncbi:MAG: hypothetical protein ACYDIE_01375 [Candidatus Krumholzibacteriia bacterium]
MAEIVARTSPLAPNRIHILDLGCRRRPGRRPCGGRIHTALEEESGVIIWECSDCDDGGVISNWQNTSLDHRASVDEPETSATSEILPGFSARASRAWAGMPAEMRIRALNNVWCAGCRSGTSMALERATVTRGDLVLHGRCTKCGGSVARVVEEVGAG